METHARYTIVGAFVLAVVLAGFAFIYWLYGVGGLEARRVYRVQYQGSVAGLLKGAAVLFNGVRVGEVLSLDIDRRQPNVVMVRIDVATDTPIRADTRAGIAFQGLTGAPAVSLLGGTVDAPALVAADGTPPTLIADPDAGLTMSEAAQGVLRRIDRLIGDNEEDFGKIVGDLATFADTLARNSERIDTVLAGIEKFTGGKAAQGQVPIYDLSSVAVETSGAQPIASRIIVAEPQTLITLNSQKIFVRDATSAGADGAGSDATGDQERGAKSVFLADALWIDALPLLVQSRIIESFERSGLMKSVGRPFGGLDGADQLLIEIRHFEVLEGREPRAAVTLAARIVSDSGEIKAADSFHSEVAIAGSETPDRMAALDRAFSNVARGLLGWVLGVARE